MILDDAIATGRTLETILRAIFLAARRSINKYALDRSPIELIHYYTILDRQGRSRGTFWTSIRKMALYGDGEWSPSKGDPSFDFYFELY